MSAFHDPQDEVGLIQIRLKQVEQLLSQLQEKRISLLQRLNNIRSPTRNLPPEILSLILEYSIESAQPEPILKSPSVINKIDNSRLISLSHVSSFWRAVAWSTPRLWTSMAVQNDDLEKSGTPEILKLHLQNVKHLPFHFHIELPWYMPEDDEDEDDEDADKCRIIIRAIESILTSEENSWKIQHLQLETPHDHWLQSMLRKLPHLTSIALVGGSSSNRIHLREFPQLTHIILRDFVSRYIQLPQSATTTLEVIGTSFGFALKVLLGQCPNLVKFRLVYPPDIASTPPVPPTIITPTTLHHLQELCLPHMSGPQYWDLIRHLRLPALRSLTWDHVHGNITWIEDATKALFKDTLKVLTLRGLREWTVPLAKHIFSRSNSIQKISLTFCDRASIYAVLYALSPYWDGVETTFLPSVTQLTFITSHDYKYSTKSEGELELGPNLSYSILDMCRARCGVPRFEMRFWFGDLRVNWAPGVLEELCMMVRDGFDLDIEDFGGMVRWR